MIVCKDCNTFFVKLRKRGVDGKQWYIVEQSLEHDVDAVDSEGNSISTSCQGTFEPGKVIFLKFMIL